MVSGWVMEEMGVMEEMEEMGEMEGAKYSLRGSSLIVTIIVTITAINAITISMGINGIIRIIWTSSP